MTERIKCGGLIERTDLSIVEIQGYDWQPGQSCGILGKFADAGIPLAFLNIGNDVNDKKIMTLCLARERSALLPAIIQKIEADFTPTRIGTRDQVVIITLYGPHFYERVALASEVYSCLCRAGIDAQAVGSSVNSISMVVGAEEAARTRDALSSRFEWPE